MGSSPMTVRVCVFFCVCVWRESEREGVRESGREVVGGSEGESWWERGFGFGVKF